MSITLEQAKGLGYRDTLYSVYNRDSRGYPQEWRVNGKPKTWKTMPERVEIGIKNGLRSYDRLTEKDLDLVCLDEWDCYTPNDARFKLTDPDKAMLDVLGCIKVHAPEYNTDQIAVFVNEETNTAFALIKTSPRKRVLFQGTWENGSFMKTHEPPDEWRGD